MNTSGFDPAIAEEKLLKAGISKKNIADYLTKYHEQVTVEQYITYCKFDEPGLNMKRYEKYLKYYSEELTLSEYVRYADAQKALRKATGNSWVDGDCWVNPYIIAYVRSNG